MSHRANVRAAFDNDDNLTRVSTRRERIASTLTRVSSLGARAQLGVASYARAYVSDAVDVDARETPTTQSRAAFASSSSSTSSRRRLGRRRGTNAPASSDFRRRRSTRARAVTTTRDARTRGPRSTRGGIDKRRDDDIEDAVTRGEARGEEWDCLFSRGRLRAAADGTREE